MDWSRTTSKNIQKSASRVTDFLKLDRLEDFPVALPVILSVQILRCLDADLVSIQRRGWRLGCWKQDAREHGKLFFVEDRQDGNIDLVKAEDLNVDRKTGGSKSWRRAWVKQSWNPQKQKADSKTRIQESENEINQWAKTRETTGSKKVWGTEMNMQRWGETLTWIHWD